MVPMDVSDMKDEDLLSGLTPDLLLLIVHHLDVCHRARLGKTCRTISAIMATSEYWMDAWCRLPNAPKQSDPRAALKSIRTLDSVHWSPMPVKTTVPWRQHFAAVSSGKHLIVYGGVCKAEQGFAKLTAWAYDLTDDVWRQAAPEGQQPLPRRFNADAGGGRILRHGCEHWCAFFGGCLEGGPRVNETWLLGPLSLPPDRWRWLEAHDDGEMQSPQRPTTRFHHQLTVLSTDAGADDVLVVSGGRNYAQVPMWDLCTLSLGDATFAYADADAGAGARALPGSAHSADEVPASALSPADAPMAVDVEWHRHRRRVDERPTARAHHCTATWARTNGELPLLIVHGGCSNVTFDEVELLSDTWVMEPMTGDWKLLDVDNARLFAGRTEGTCTVGYGAAMSAVGDQLVLMAGYGFGEANPTTANALPVWTLNLRTPTAWLSVESLGRPRCWHPTLLPVLGGEALIVFGGARPTDVDDMDNFGDPLRGFLALHETSVLRVCPPSDEAPPSPSHTIAKVAAATRGGAHLQAAVGTTSWFVEADESRFLVHGLRNEQHAALNGCIGNAVTDGPAVMTTDRVGMRVSGRDVSVKRANLVPSSGPNTHVILPVDGNGVQAVAIHCSTLHGRLHSFEPGWDGHLQVSKLSLLP